MIKKLFHTKATINISILIMTSLVSSGCVTRNSIYTGVAESTIANYETAKRNGLKSEQCVYAKAAMHAYLNLADDASLAKWKAVAENDCAKK